MNKRNCMTIIGENNSTEEVEVLVGFEIHSPAPSSKYLVYTKNERADDGTIITYISRLERSTSIPELKRITQEEYERCQTVLNEIIGSDKAES